VTNEAAVPINNSILKWAREEAGFSLVEAATKAKISELKPRGKFLGLKPWERLKQWEEGVESPSLNQLKQVAKAYRRPILTFFLQKEPQNESFLRDFRTVGERPVSYLKSPEFAALVRRIEALQKHTKMLLEERQHERVPFVGSINTDEDMSSAVDKIRKALNFPFDDQQRISNKNVLLGALRERAEGAGVFIIFEGNLGSWHTDISPDVFRGLVISDDTAPFIVINPNDSKAAQVFTLAHELVHLWLGDNGVSNFDSLHINREGVQEREKYCNGVAAEFLVPKRWLILAWKNKLEEDLNKNIKSLSAKFKVSEICIARRLVDLRLISKETYWEQYALYIARLKALRQKQRESETGPDPTILKRYKLGTKLIHTIGDATEEGRISELEASQLLNIKIDSFHYIYHSAA